jgi:hypothetical protein
MNIPYYLETCHACADKETPFFLSLSYILQLTCMHAILCMCVGESEIVGVFYYCGS